MWIIILWILVQDCTKITVQWVITKSYKSTLLKIIYCVKIVIAIAMTVMGQVLMNVYFVINLIIYKTRAA